MRSCIGYATAQISEAYLIPVLEAMLAQFPFRIRGFHFDNGSESINDTVAKLLNKQLVEQTKSRPRHSKTTASRKRRTGRGAPLAGGPTNAAVLSLQPLQ